MKDISMPISLNGFGCTQFQSESLYACPEPCRLSSNMQLLPFPVSPLLSFSLCSQSFSFIIFPLGSTSRSFSPSGIHQCHMRCNQTSSCLRPFTLHFSLPGQCKFVVTFSPICEQKKFSKNSLLTDTDPNVATKKWLTDSTKNSLY